MLAFDKTAAESEPETTGCLWWQNQVTWYQNQNITIGQHWAGRMAVCLSQRHCICSGDTGSLEHIDFIFIWDVKSVLYVQFQSRGVRMLPLVREVQEKTDYIWFIVKFFLSPPQICTVEAEKSLCFIVLNMMEVVWCLWFSVRRTVFFLFHSSFSPPRSVKPLPAAALAAVTDWRLSDFLKVGRNYLFNLLCQISPSACGSNWYHSCHFIPLWHATWSHPVMH